MEKFKKVAPGLIIKKGEISAIVSGSHENLEREGTVVYHDVTIYLKDSQVPIYFSTKKEEEVLSLVEKLIKMEEEKNESK